MNNLPERQPMPGGGFIDRRVDETDAEFSLRVSRERASARERVRQVTDRRVGVSPLEKFRRLWR